MADQITTSLAQAKVLVMQGQKGDTGPQGPQGEPGTVDDGQIADAVADYLDGHPVTVTETDPTVPGWAKQPDKPTYTAAEVGAVADTANTTNNLGFCYVNIGAGQTATELVGTNANYIPKNGGIIVGRFLVDVPANAAINISGKGAKAVYFRNSAIVAGVIKTGDVAAFVYYPDRYYLFAIDRAGQSELPAVAASDNGKFLRVVSGAWAAQAVPSAESSSFGGGS